MTPILAADFSPSLLPRSPTPRKFNLRGASFKPNTPTPFCRPPAERSQGGSLRDGSPVHLQGKGRPGRKQTIVRQGLVLNRLNWASRRSREVVNGGRAARAPRFVLNRSGPRHASAVKSTFKASRRSNRL